MAKFYKNVSARIDSLNSFDETIDRINELNIQLLNSLKERSKFPVCRDYFKNTPQRELESQGIDTIQLDKLYFKVTEKICPEGEYIEGVIEAESKLEELIFERINIGKKVIEYKEPRGIPIDRWQREKQILSYMAECALNKDMNPSDVRSIFQFLMNKNKDYQRQLRKSIRCNLTEIEVCKTQSLNCIPILKGILERKGENYKEQTGTKYYIKIDEKIESGSLIYHVKLLQE